MEFEHHFPDLLGREHGTPFSGASTPYSVGLENDPEDSFALQGTGSKEAPLVIEGDDAMNTSQSSQTFQQPSQPLYTLDRRTKLPAWIPSSWAGKSISLHSEILAFCEYARPCKREEKRRSELVASIDKLVRALWPQATIRLFGSFDTALHLPLSDLDIVVFNADPNRNSKQPMFKLARALRAQAFTTNLQVIAHARVPIIKLTDKHSHIDVDISFEQNSGLSSSVYVKNALRKWPELKPLVLTMKYFLKLRNLNEPFTGGVGSYALVMLALSHLQMSTFYSPSSNGEITNDLGYLLTTFLDLYGRKFNYITTGLSVRGQGSYFPKVRRGWFQPDAPLRLSVEDPQDPDNDIGKSSREILKIQQSFAESLAALMCLSRSDTVLQTPLQVVFGTNHEMLARHRDRVGLGPQASDEAVETTERKRDKNRRREVDKDKERGNKGKRRSLSQGSRGEPFKRSRTRKNE
eukprot:c18683_g1_i10.p1 GENE.c18683_g1_i10~~c18683_g1_i10.p1  ORF type:complete len:464 (+),score=83.80 c18683_g1_i10:1089-2480(+)